MTAIAIAPVNSAPAPELDAAADSELMRHWQHGSQAAFECLYRRYSGAVYRVLLRATGDRSLADELFQEAWERVIAHRDRYRADASFPAWIHRIAGNLAIDRRRRDRVSPLVVSEIAETLARDSAPGPEQALANDEDGARLQQALAALPPDQRLAFLLRAEQGFSLAEIAEATGVGQETAKSRLRYALERLRRSLQP